MLDRSYRLGAHQAIKEALSKNVRKVLRELRDAVNPAQARGGGSYSNLYRRG